MNSKSRILPHLNICYLQKKAYDVHRKKIESIKNSLRSSMIRKVSNLAQNQNMQEKINRKDSPAKMSTIKEEGSETRMSRMKPLNKRKYFQQVKQNQRLNKRIETCASTINRKIIETHKIRSEELKNRISKFKNDPSSHKSQLKSQRSLQFLEKLRVKQKYRDSSNFYNQNSSSKILSEVVQINQRSKSLISKQPQRFTPDTKTEIRSSLNKKSSLDRLMSIRHTRKIQSHFESQNQKFRPGKNFSALRQKYKSNNIKQKVRTEVNQQFWKSRCFTTQLEHY